MTRRDRLLCLTLLAVCCVQTYPQNKPVPSIEQKSMSSPCSNNVAAGGSTINIKCTNLTPEQVKALQQVSSTLNKLLALKLSVDGMNRRLTELEQTLTRPEATVSAPHGAAIGGDAQVNAYSPLVESCPNGICISGGNVQNPTVNNFNQINPYLTQTIYEPNGVKRSVSQAGNRTDIDTSLILVFRQIVTLEKNGDWNAVLDLIAQTRTTDPGWFTLDILQSDAEAAQCRLDLAKAHTEKFISETEGIDVYAKTRGQAISNLAFLQNFAPFVPPCAPR